MSSIAAPEQQGMSPLDEVGWEGLDATRSSGRPRRASWCEVGCRRCLLSLTR